MLTDVIRRVGTAGRGISFKCALAAGLTIGLDAFAAAQQVPTSTPNQEVWIADHDVNYMSVKDRTLYITGGFESVGPSTGSMAIVDPSNGNVDTKWPRIDGTVNKILEDGEGGFYIGGNFTKVGSASRKSLAWIRPNGDVDPWNPGVTGIVNSMVLVDNTLYIAGAFVEVGPIQRNCLAAIHARTGALLPWNPLLGPQWFSPETLWSIAYDNETIYAGGNFVKPIGGFPRKHAFAVSTETGQVLPFDPQADASVLTVKYSNGAVLLAGNFFNLGATPRRRIAEVDGQTGMATSWNVGSGAESGFSGGVISLHESKGIVYCGGTFQSVAGLTRRRVAALDRETGDVLTWNPDIEGEAGGSLVVSVSLDLGTSIAIGGHFTTVKGKPRRHLAFVRPPGAPQEGEPLDVKVDVAGKYAESVKAIAGTPDYIAVGGDFRIVGAVQRTGLAAIDLDTGRATDFAPVILNTQGNPVGAGARVSGDFVFLYGNFSSVNGVPRRLIAKVNHYTGELDATFKASLFDGSASSSYANVHAISSTGKLVVTTNIPGKALLFLNSTTGAVDPQWIGTAALPTIYSVKLSLDETRLYLTSNGTFQDGSFTTKGIASHILTTGKLDTAFKPAFVGPGSPSINDTHPTSNGVFVGGTFAAGEGRDHTRNIGRFNSLTGGATGWTADIGSTVNAIGVRNGVLFAGGNFHLVNRIWCAALIAIDESTGEQIPWLVDDAVHEVSRIVVTDDEVIVAGPFENIAHVRQQGLAVFPFRK